LTFLSTKRNRKIKFQNHNTDQQKVYCQWQKGWATEQGTYEHPTKLWTNTGTDFWVGRKNRESFYLKKLHQFVLQEQLQLKILGGLP
jgi:hypothetical protein